MTSLPAALLTLSQLAGPSAPVVVPVGLVPQRGQLIVDYRVGEINEFTNAMTLAEHEAVNFGVELLRKAEAEQSDLALFVERPPFSKAAIFTIDRVQGTRKWNVSMSMHNRLENPAIESGPCAESAMASATAAQRYTRCYRNMDFYSNSGYPSLGQHDADKIGLLIREFSERELAGQNTGARRAIEVLDRTENAGLGEELALLERRMRVVNDHQGRHFFPQLIIAAHGYTVDLSAPALWRKIPGEKGDQEAWRMIQAARLLESVNRVFIDRNILCGARGPRVTEPGELCEDAASHSMRGDSYQELVQAMGRAGYAWDDASGTWK